MMWPVSGRVFAFSASQGPNTNHGSKHTLRRHLSVPPCGAAHLDTHTHTHTHTHSLRSTQPDQIWIWICMAIFSLQNSFTRILFLFSSACFLCGFFLFGSLSPSDSLPPPPCPPPFMHVCEAVNRPLTFPQ